MTLEKITESMNRLEVMIAREQAYIAKHSAANDLDSDTAWESYKETAEMHLAAWDAMKAKRDALKLAA